MAFFVHITGNPNIPTLRFVNIRQRPSTSPTSTALRQQLVGLRDLPVLAVSADEDNSSLNGRVYQWFRVRLPDGIEGWVRDDLVEVSGDGTPFGYPMLGAPQWALRLTRQIVTPTPLPTPQPIPGRMPRVLTPPGSPTATLPPVLGAPAVPIAPILPPPPADGVRGIAIARTGLNLRMRPVDGAPIARLDYREEVAITAVERQPASNYLWARIRRASGVEGWVRTDHLSIRGDGRSLGLSAGDEYAAPMTMYWWERGFNVGHNAAEPPHFGWDFGAAVGEPIRAGRAGGVVADLLVCKKCTAEKPSAVDQGLDLNDPNVLRSADWGFGYGNAVIVRYDHGLLPDSARGRLTAQGMSGAHVYVIYAHLATIAVQRGAQLAPNATLGTCGNTGNSSGPHLHLEIRLSPSMTASWGSLGATIRDPELLFLR